jgi:hypothetical protein
MSIEDVVSRADLADRGIFLTLAPIGAQQRRAKPEPFNNSFDPVEAGLRGRAREFLQGIASR